MGGITGQRLFGWGTKNGVRTDKGGVSPDLRIDPEDQAREAVGPRRRHGLLGEERVESRAGIGQEREEALGKEGDVG